MSDQNKTVTLFIQCLVDGIYPEVGEAMVRIFRKLGINLICPTKQTCCGQPAFNAGYHSEARVAAKRFINIFEAAEVMMARRGVIFDEQEADIMNHVFELTKNYRNY